MTTGEDKKRLVIVGATGMVGGYALRCALEHPSVGRVTVIGRRSLGMSHPKLVEVLHRDFGDCSSLEEVLENQDAAVFCLGVYTGVVSDAELRHITVDCTIEFARVLKAGSPDAAFSFLSGNGADRTEKSRIPFARYKGKEELGLSYNVHRVFLGGEQKTPEFRKLNPNQKIPVRVDNGFVLSESGAILICLADKTAKLLSKDPKTREGLPRSRSLLRPAPCLRPRTARCR